MKASVLPLSWPAGVDPFDRKNFETNARTLRYQALGRACQAARIRKLFLAHHADDQAETVLMRLANNRLRSGLQAMQPVEWIPECFGMHGVSHSGNCQSNDREPFRRMPFPVESGGVRMLRPLLGFEKSRLIATCEHHGVAWAEDKTNHLQTYTSRNAIRHVLKKHELPVALSIKSLVNLSLHMQKRVNGHQSRTRHLLDKCHKKLDIQSGRLFIRFPAFSSLLPVDAAHPLTQSDWNEAKNTAYCLLEQVGQLITPQENAPLGGLAATVENIWPEFQDLEDSDMSQHGASAKTNYCIYSIWWRKSDRPSLFYAFRKTHPREWMLTRQPLENHRPDTSPESIQYPPSHMPLTTKDLLPIPKNVPTDGYHLFDGRWWISIKNYSTDVLTLRIFTKDDLAAVRNSKRISSTEHNGLRPERFVDAALSLLKPADLRFTLPAVFRRDSVTKEETLVGFPTLNVSMGQLGCPEDICSWRVRYKKVNLSPEALSMSVVPGITHNMIQNELYKIETSAKNMRQRAAGASAAQHAAKWTRKPVKTPIIPVAESHRHGRSVKRGGGGYNMNWEDIKFRSE